MGALETFLTWIFGIFIVLAIIRAFAKQLGIPIPYLNEKGKSKKK